MTRFALALAFLLASKAAIAQGAMPANSVTVRNLTLVNLTQLPVEDYQQIAQDIESRRYQSDWPSEIRNRVHYAFQQRGYFRAEVGEAESTVITEIPGEMVIDVAFRVNAGSLYHLDSIVV